MMNRDGLRCSASLSGITLCGIAFASLLALGSVAARASDDFQVNTYGPSNHVVCCPKIATAADGRFVVVWVSAGSPGTDQDAGSIQARLYDADGMPRSDQFQVNTLTHWWQEHPSVAMDAAVGFVIAWESWESAEDDDSGTSIQARRYSANGEPWGSEFQVNTSVSGYQGSPSVAMRPDGREFVVAWGSGRRRDTRREPGSAACRTAALARSSRDRRQSPTCPRVRTG